MPNMESGSSNGKTERKDFASELLAHFNMSIRRIYDDTTRAMVPAYQQKEAAKIITDAVTKLPRDTSIVIFANAMNYLWDVDPAVFLGEGSVEDRSSPRYEVLRKNLINFLLEREPSGPLEKRKYIWLYGLLGLKESSSYLPFRRKEIDERDLEKMPTEEVVSYIRRRVRKL
jgi:hypothetical protein